MQPLGEGGTGETFLCKRKSNGVEEAVKIIRRPLPNALRELVTNEIILQASIGEAHVNVVKARSVILTESHICLVMDFVPGGTLTDLVHDRAMAKGKQEGLCIEEDEARFLFRVRLHCLLLPATRLSAYDVLDDTTSHPSSSHTVRTTSIWHRMLLICPPVFFLAVLGVPALPRASQSRGLRYVEVYICTSGKRCNAYGILLHTLITYTLLLLPLHQTRL